MFRALIALLAVVIVIPIGQQPVSASGGESYILESINIMREKHGLRQLKLAPRVQKIAGIRSRSMAKFHYFGHTAPDGLTAAKLLRRRHIRHEYSGEIIAATSYLAYPESLFWSLRAWMLSPPHRHEILRRGYTHAGVGIARSAHAIYFTVVFIRRTPRR